MTGLLTLIPAALGLGLLALIAFFWALRAGQFEDLDGAGGRLLFDDDPPAGEGRRGTSLNRPPRRSS